MENLATYTVKGFFFNSLLSSMLYCFTIKFKLNQKATKIELRITESPVVINCSSNLFFQDESLESTELKHQLSYVPVPVPALQH